MAPQERSASAADAFRAGSAPGSSAESAIRPATAPDRAWPRLDGYDIIDAVGRGGMGVVYEAVQRSTGRRVAIKFMLDSAFASETARRRFEREVALAAQLDHPGIVRVIESGLDRGQYFLVMEFVDGRPLDSLCRPSAHDASGAPSHQPAHAADSAPDGTPEDAVRLVATLCDALDHAHQRGVLHRDLKPSNILVDGRNQPRILDFGLAKQVGDGAPRGATLSEPGQILGTLAYMAPEQARGDERLMSVRADIYSLGAILYQLLTGRPPIDADRPLGEVLDRIAHVDPPPPSSVGLARDAVADLRAMPAGRRWSFSRRRFSTDIDAIVLKALDKDPARRYATAAEFAADLRRYLAHEPVVARRTGLPARAARWVRRNRAVALLGVIAVAAVLAGGVAAYLRLVSERDRALARGAELAAREKAVVAAAQARAESRKARAINYIVGGILSYTEPNRSADHEVTVRELLDGAVASLKTNAVDEPEVIESVRSMVGNMYAQLGLYDEAEPMLRQALTAQEKLLGPDHFDVADTLGFLATLLADRGKAAEAEPLYRRQIEILRRTYGSRDLFVAATLNGLADALRQLPGRLDEAESALRESLTIQRESAHRDPAVYAQALNELGIVMKMRWRPDEADRTYREALEYSRRELGEKHPRTAAIMANLAMLLWDRGDFAEAERWFRAALSIQQGVYGRDHPQVAMTLDSLGNVLCASGHYEEGERMIRQAIDIYSQRGGRDGPDMAMALGGLAAALLGKGDLKEAERAQRESVRLCRRTLGRSHFQVAVQLCRLASILLKQDKAAAAEKQARAAMQIVDRPDAADDPTKAMAQFVLGRAILEQGRAAEAEPLLREAVSTGSRNLPAGHPWLAGARVSLGACLIDLHHPDEARRLLLDGLAVLEHDPVHPADAAYALRSLIRLCSETNRPEQAAEFRRRLAVVESQRTSPASAASSAPASRASP